jgi:4a-hydroxytetrahydrobiopterin dehydratase
MNNDEQRALLAELPDWHIAGDAEDKQIRRTFQFTNYAEGLKFTADLGVLAENCGYYPTIITAYQKVTVMWHTTESENLQINDFILAAKTSALIAGS